MAFYKNFLKPIFFLFDPEFMHDRMIALGEMLGRFSLGRAAVRAFCDFHDPALETEVLGIRFKNPVGLAAGFDKDVRLTHIIPSVGFGFMEVGSITRYASPGNPGKHLVRLPKDNSLIVYYGLKNIGADAVLKKIKGKQWMIPTGLNIAKTNRADIKGEKSIEDYVYTYRHLAPYFSYTTINVSCPNTQDGHAFQEPTMLDALLRALAREPKTVPVFLKLSNHLTLPEVDDILAVVVQYGFVDGFIVSNLSKKRDALGLVSPPELLAQLPYGGISGTPLKEKTNKLISYLYKKTNGKYALIGLGGIFSAEDAYEKIKAGASLVQLITGMIYEGPTLIKRINRGLVALLARDGYRTIADAVGKGI